MSCLFGLNPATQIMSKNKEGYPANIEKSRFKADRLKHAKDCNLSGNDGLQDDIWGFGTKIRFIN